MTQQKDLRGTLRLENVGATIDVPWVLEGLLSRIEALEAQASTQTPPSEPSTTQEPSPDMDPCGIGRCKATHLLLKSVHPKGAAAKCRRCGRVWPIQWLEKEP